MSTATSTFERDQEIVRLWNTEALTLDAIGQQYGLTRERVRQIVTKAGAAGSLAVRAKRAEKKASAVSVEINEFLAGVRDILKALQMQGDTTTEVRGKLAAIYPDKSDAVIEGAIKRSRLVFKKMEPIAFFTDAAIQAGVWHAFGRDNAAIASRDAALATLDAALLQEIVAALEVQNVSAENIEEALRYVAGGRAAIAVDNDLAPHMAHHHYESIRETFLAANGIVSAKGAMLWPPTRQTVMKRLGNNSWSDALASMGAKSSPRGGRPKGQLIFSADDYAASIRDYLAYCEAYSKRATYVNYEAWVKTEKVSNRARPSGASVRNIYGSWIDAVQAEGDPKNVGLLTK